jgi:hypothetical protein
LRINGDSRGVFHAQEQETIKRLLGPLDSAATPGEDADGDQMVMKADLVIWQ